MSLYGKSPVARALKEFLKLVSLEDMARRFALRYKHTLADGDSGFTKVERKEDGDDNLEGGSKCGSR